MDGIERLLDQTEMSRVERILNQTDEVKALRRVARQEYLRITGCRGNDRSMLVSNCIFRMGLVTFLAVLFGMSLQAYDEAKDMIQKGDKVWQIAFGSGFKCNSSVWRALTNVIPIGEKNPWTDEINDFPVSVPQVQVFE
ncbi:hypothetical protein POM88_026371 [Heracleum sosnowskyi]|uniref:Uncharacterized protein n=1 Tax=Heracleum sosnowskyi TaxID=360622 RepID=A0AAD8I5Q3_9APIA|nr:hypothetical protein POM88_026371 [Heracleum sosnowskyi]